MNSSKQKEIRAYLQSGAGGTFYGTDSHDVLLKALKHSKIAGVSAGELEATLTSYGITVDSVRGAYRLVLPLASK